MGGPAGNIGPLNPALMPAYGWISQDRRLGQPAFDRLLALPFFSTESATDGGIIYDHRGGFFEFSAKYGVLGTACDGVSAGFIGYVAADGRNLSR